MKKLLFATAAASLISASAMALPVQCPSIAQVNASITKLSDGLYGYQLTDGNDIGWTSTTDSAIKPSGHAITSMSDAQIFPEAFDIYNGDMHCDYNSTQAGVVTLYTQTLVQPAGNTWKLLGGSNGVYTCTGNSYDCIAALK